VIEDFPEHLVVPQRLSDETIEAAGLGSQQHSLSKRDADALPLPFVPDDQAYLDTVLVDCDTRRWFGSLRCPASSIG
jgi:hypothetical protein